MTAIYLDHNATTPLDPEVRAAMEASQDSFGNPSSIHAAGQEARRIIDLARARVAGLIGAQPDEILFTSGGTEANNLAILGGAAAATASGRQHIVASAIEHQAVLNPCRQLAKIGHPFTLLPVDSEGVIQQEAMDIALRDDTALVSVMLANNDTGAIQPVAEITRRSRSKGAVVHSDAIQAIGKIPVNVTTLGVDLLSLSAHKLHGPKGAGALFVRGGTKLTPICFGGRHERGLRPGTENVAAIAGFGQACELAAQRLDEDAARLAALRAWFEDEVLRRVPGARINGSQAPRLPNTSSIAFDGIDGEVLVINLDLLGVAVSTGAACSNADHEPSHVLLAMGRSPAEARSTIRVSLGRTNREEELSRAIACLCQAVKAMRGSRS